MALGLLTLGGLTYLLDPHLLWTYFNLCSPTLASWLSTSWSTVWSTVLPFEVDPLFWSFLWDCVSSIFIIPAVVSWLIGGFVAVILCPTLDYAASTGNSFWTNVNLKVHNFLEIPSRLCTFRVPTPWSSPSFAKPFFLQSIWWCYSSWSSSFLSSLPSPTRSFCYRSPTDRYKSLNCRSQVVDVWFLELVPGPSWSRGRIIGLESSPSQLLPSSLAQLSPLVLAVQSFNTPKQTSSSSFQAFPSSTQQIPSHVFSNSASNNSQFASNSANSSSTYHGQCCLPYHEWCPDGCNRQILSVAPKGSIVPHHLGFRCNNVHYV